MHPPLRVLEAVVSGDSVDERSLAHIAECQACQAKLGEIERENKFLSKVVAAAKSAASEASMPAPLANVPRIPGYENLTVIRRGGQGVVFRAMQVATKREVAIKMPLSGSFVSDREKLRFELEIELIAQMQHPNIVTIHDSGVTAEGRCYIVMEFIDGVTLDQFISSGGEHSTWTGRRRTEFIIRLFAKLASALQHAHARGVIHRDIKPGNVVVDGRGEPHLLDFGLARRGEWSPENSPTEMGAFHGTLDYASPEQVVGDPRGIDARTDLYSLGVMLYRALTNEKPYSLDGSISAKIDHIKRTLPMAPSRRERSIDQDLDTIILTMLAKEPVRRYQSAAALSSDLNAWLAGDPIAARPASVLYVIRKAVVRRKGVTAAVVAVLLALGAWGWAIRSAQQAAARLEAAQIQAQSAAASLAQRLISQIAAAAGGELQQSFARRVLDVAAKDLDEGLGLDQPVTHAAMRRQLGVMYAQFDQHSAALHQFEAAGAVLDARAQAAREERAQVRMLSARELAELGRAADAADTARRALELCNLNTVTGRSEALTARARLLEALVKRGKGEGLAEEISAARASLDRSKDASVESRAALLGALALAELATGSTARASDNLKLMAAAMNGGAYRWAAGVVAIASEGLPELPAEKSEKLAAALVQHADDVIGAMRAILNDERTRAAELLYAASQSARAMGDARRVIAIARCAADVALEQGGRSAPLRLRAVQAAADASKSSGDFAGEYSLLTEALDGADASSSPNLTLQIQLLDAMRVNRGAADDMNAALAASERACGMLAKLTQPMGSLTHMLEHAKLLRRAGRHADAMEWIGQCAWFARQTGQSVLLGQAMSLQAGWLGAADELGAAIAPLIAGEDLTRPLEAEVAVFGRTMKLVRLPALMWFESDASLQAVIENLVEGLAQTTGATSGWERAALEQAVMYYESRGMGERAGVYRRRLVR